MDQRTNRQVGTYRIVERIASGSYGVVYRGEHIHLGHSVAIKFLHTDLNTPQQREAFLQEAKTLAALKHPHIVHLLDYNVDHGTPYLVSEYASEGSLRTYLSRQATLPLTVREARKILVQIGLALSYIHSQGIIHRDLKPENILFTSTGSILLADFGIARMQHATGASRSSTGGGAIGLGTPAYMAPEQFTSGGARPSPKSDQFALGCIAYELLTGQLPFTSENIWAYAYQHQQDLPQPLRDKNPALSVYIEQAVLTALAKEPENRHTDIETFLQALGVPRSALKEADFPSASLKSLHSRKMHGANDATQLKQHPEPLPVEDNITTQLAPPRKAVKQAFPFGRTTVPAHPTPVTATRPPRSSALLTRQAEPLLAPRSSAQQQISRWKRLQTMVAGASIFTIIKWLFLVVALIDLGLLLCGWQFGTSTLALLGTILAALLCIFGLALNFFTKPWIWLMMFLLLSPLPGLIYLLAVSSFHAQPGAMNWQLYCGYLLFAPGAGILYGLFGPNSRHDQPITQSFVKAAALTIWSVGAVFCLTGLIAPFMIYFGLGWACASGFLAVAQSIRLKQWDWLQGVAVSSAFTLGLAFFLCGLAYGISGPTTENDEI